MLPDVLVWLAPGIETEVIPLLSVVETVYVTVCDVELLVSEIVLSLTEKDDILGDCVSDLVMLTLQVDVVELPAASVEVAVKVCVVLPHPKSA